MGKQWARQEIKKDIVTDSLNRAVSWVLANREKAAAIGGGILAVLVFGSLFIRARISARNTAWERLAIAQSYSYQGKADQAVQLIQALPMEFGTTAATGFGLVFSGDLLYRQGRYKEAIESYQQVLSNPYPKEVVPFALCDLGISQEASGDCKSAVESDQRFLDTYPDHFLSPQTHASLARCLEALGQKDKAKAAYERISLLYPDTYWARWAQGKLKS